MLIVINSLNGISKPHTGQTGIISGGGESGVEESGVLASSGCGIGGVFASNFHLLASAGVIPPLIAESV